MIGYITLGSKDLAASTAFYDVVLAQIGGTRAYTLDSMVAWGFGPQHPLLCVVTPHDRASASTGNGTMVALMAPGREVVDALHRTALASGGADEGAPGLRGVGFYAAYFRDPDGNKLNAFVRD